MAEDLGERTEEPTARRLAQARRDGQIPKSQDLSAAVDLAASILIVVVFGGAAIFALAQHLRSVLGDQVTGALVDTDAIPAAMMVAGRRLAMILGPALALVFVVASVAQIAQVGWQFSTRPLKPRLTRLNPVSGLQRLFGRRNLVKTVVNVAKLSLVVGVAWAVLARQVPQIVALPRLELVPAMTKLALFLLELAAWLSLVLIILGLIDLRYQRWQHRQDLKMTRHQVKDERRSMEGDPEVRARRLKMAMAIAMQRIDRAVPRADVVVTNPTHFAVALGYDSATMRAPRVLAKGADMMAWRVRQVAMQHGVPIVERPPLARSLYWGVEVGREVAPEFYEAVAEVLAYVYRLEREAAV